MHQAISLYNGQLIEAEDVDYSDYLDRGFCCPVCGSAVFLTKGFKRGTVSIASHFKHHKGSGLLCESRAKSSEYKQFLAKFTSEARGQRLTVFNDRFWRIYKYQKHLPPNFREIYRDSKVKEMAKHCHKLWDVFAWEVDEKTGFAPSFATAFRQHMPALLANPDDFEEDNHW